MPTKVEKDSVTGTTTTGHEWDGIKELDTPMPKWWVYVFITCVIWAFGYCVLYPSVPYGTGHTNGLLGYSSRKRVDAEVAAVHASHADAMARIASLPFAQIRADRGLMEMAVTSSRITFAENCAPCHGAGGAGRPGYPALAAGAWIWGGSFDDLQQTVQHGIRSNDPEARQSQMPAFGTSGALDNAQIEQVADYVWKAFYGHEGTGDTAPGAALFAENCPVCHGEKGEGNREMGAPRLASHVHLYGDNRDQVVTQIRLGRGGVMPNWSTRLDPATLRSVVLYVHSLGGGE